jgi:hypothetical protein
MGVMTGIAGDILTNDMQAMDPAGKLSRAIDNGVPVMALVT